MLNLDQLVREQEARRNLGLKAEVTKALEQAGPEGIQPTLEGRIVTLSKEQGSRCAS